MRINALAVLALVVALIAADTSVAQAPASAKSLGVTQTTAQQTSPVSLIQRRAQAAAACAAEQQAMQPAQPQLAMPQQAMPQQTVAYIPQPGDVQLAGHHYASQQYGCPPMGPYGGAPLPYGSHDGYLHPGRPFDGGHYGYFGGAHRTPGYPHHHLHREYVGPPGPPTAQVAYPYYTVRGPRDFLIDNPPSIGR